ncbi:MULTISPECIES: hypothetical protein [unclassified Maribacter]|uniref:hypothetical protein n=1 Tax=unclassified Maribacter TaxID=2615042 RepID=UPI00257F022B|nr:MULTISPECIES: hypothetical protein [unclassified Maribacter]|tara:strand:+ start:97057 stop:97542 length:486 start_codon:yes stop_codon:yes gene_type:complete
MKNLLTALKWLINFLIFSVLISIIINLGELSKYVLTKFDLLQYSGDENSWILMVLIPLPTVLLQGYIIWLLLKFRKVIPEFKTDTIFTEKNSAIFRKVGNGLIAYSVLIFFIRLIEKSFEITLEYGVSASYTLGKNFGTALSGRISLLVIAIFLLNYSPIN